MATFTVEDGTGLANATSYVDLIFADDYLGATWGANDTEKQGALMAATEYFDLRWGARLTGYPLTSTQALQLPRTSMYNNYGTTITGIPDQIKKAVCLYAVEYLSSTLYPAAQTTAKEVKRKKTTVGPITTEYEYAGVNSASTFLNFPKADTFVYAFIRQGNRVIRG